MTISAENSDGKQSIRAAMPHCTAFLDDIRKHFGDPVRIVASEAGREVVWVAPRLRAAAGSRRVPVWVVAAPPADLLLQKVAR